MRRALLALLAAAVAFMALATPAAAADPVVTGFRLQDANRLTVGDRFRIVVTVEVDAGSTVYLAPGTLPAELSLVETPRTRTRPRGGGRTEVTLEILVAPFFVGQHAVEPLTLRVRDASGRIVDVQTPRAPVVVGSVLPTSGNVAPRDLKPQAEIGVPVAPPYVYIALSVLVVALVAALALLYWRLRRPAPPVVAPPPPDFVPVGPEDRARLALDHAAAAFAAEREHIAFYATIAGVVRGYLTDRFGFPAYALTTRELEQRMRTLGLDRWQVRLVSGLLSNCDAVVYASYRPAAERSESDLTAAYEIVEMSRPFERAREVEVAQVSLA